MGTKIDRQKIKNKLRSFIRRKCNALLLNIDGVKSRK
jgi:hypothetical protein